MVAIATAATVVASQALISGAFSLTQQAVQLGFFPRVTIVHTSKATEGQIYIPEINTALMLACIGSCCSFKSSTALAAAYGIAVTGTMAITTVVYYVVVTRTWGWSPLKAGALAGLFLVVRSRVLRRERSEVRRRRLVPARDRPSGSSRS